VREVHHFRTLAQLATERDIAPKILLKKSYSSHRNRIIQSPFDTHRPPSSGLWTVGNSTNIYTALFLGERSSRSRAAKISKANRMFPSSVCLLLTGVVLVFLFFFPFPPPFFLSSSVLFLQRLVFVLSLIVCVERLQIICIPGALVAARTRLPLYR